MTRAGRRAGARRGPAWALRSCAAVVLGALATSFAGCSLGNVAQDECETSVECQEAFGIGSVCSDGYCSDAISCGANIDCRGAIGTGAMCEDGVCVAVPASPACTESEPPELAGLLPGSLGQDRIVLGAIFKLGSEKEAARAAAVRLAIEEINDVAGGIQGRKLGVLVCDNDIDGSASNDEEETRAVVDYLAGKLGVPVIVGPSSSANAQAATNHIIERGLDTLLVSPSATGVSLTDLADRLSPGDPLGLFWRTCPSDRLQAKRLSQIVDGDGANDVALLFQNDSYGTGMRDAFREFFEVDPANAVTTFPFEIDAEPQLSMNIQAAVASAAASTPDAVVVVSGDASRTVIALAAGATSPALADLPWFLTDGSKDAAVLLSTGSPAVDSILAEVRGTAPANPTSGNFFDSLIAKGFNAAQFSFVAHAYDAAYVSGYGAAYASGRSATFAGRLVAEGMSLLSDGNSVDVGPTQFLEAVNDLRSSAPGVDITGTSGPLDFDATTGEAPGAIEVWRVNPAFDGFEVVGDPVIP